MCICNHFEGGWLKYQVLFAAVCNCFKKTGNLKLKVISLACQVLHINSTMIWYPSLKNGEIKGKEKNKLWCYKNMCGACGCQLIRNKTRQVHTVVHLVCVLDIFAGSDLCPPLPKCSTSCFFYIQCFSLTPYLFWRTDGLKHLKSLFHPEKKNNLKNYLDINVF